MSELRECHAPDKSTEEWARKVTERIIEWMIQGHENPDRKELFRDAIPPIIAAALTAAQASALDKGYDKGFAACKFLIFELIRTGAEEGQTPEQTLNMIRALHTKEPTP